MSVIQYNITPYTIQYHNYYNTKLCPPYCLLLCFELLLILHSFEIFDSCVPSSGFISHDTSVSQITSIPRIESPPPPTSNDNHFAEITSTPRIEQPSVSYHEHQLFLESTPGGTELWSRNVAIQFKPQLGQIFAKLEDAISFYNVYTEAWFRDGKKRKAIVHDSVVEQPLIKLFDIKNNKLTRIGCDAMIEFRLIKDVYVVTQFREWHNHRLCSLTNQEFQRKKRHLHLFHKKAIIDHSKVNLGPTSAYRYSKEHADGYENVGAQLIDFKNFGRDIKCFIGDKDAQLFIDNFENLRQTNPGFYFAYEVDSFKCLVRVFWCGLADHHKRSVTFAAALLFHEDDDSFKWVFEKFLDAMGQREPQCIISDQCPGIKKVVPKVFKKAKHRYCMWHIMQKVPDKIGITISKETDFVSRLNSVVWDSDLEPAEFERKWFDLIAEHNLQANSWLSYMYKKRRRWIPAYYRDIPMGCLLRTTQRSESQNSFFKRFENIHGTLVEFWMRFQSAMDQQRHTQKQHDRDSDYTLPQLATSLHLEAHASKVYTHAIFKDFQQEATASMCSLSVGGFTPPVDGTEVIVVTDARMQKSYQNAQKIPLYGSHGELLDDFDATDVRKLEMCKLWSEFYSTISLLRTMPNNQITDLADTLKQFRVKLNPQAQSMTKEQELEMLLGCSSSTEVRILPPRQAKNKGSGKRMISTKQQCIAKAEKPKRLCKNCKQLANHDKRIALILLYLTSRIRGVQMMIDYVRRILC
ncbi:protein FAR1-RELATED SEQUENCE 5-like [Silene latifolia]|uniref:protein FAR1-RELATED SEQUENCE 5-like n=1 Tax=Silene latifolia TaxID=37657 RepID=UPI003D7763C3